ncbi:MAG: hypothetical protein WCA08_05540 [Desulfoferrobacter sp.]
MKHRIQLLCAFLSILTLLVLVSSSALLAAGQEEVIAGTLVKTDEGIIIEADDGDYLVKGKDLSDMIGKFVEATGYITETDQGYVIEVKKVEELQE